MLLAALPLGAAASPRPGADGSLGCCVDSVAVVVDDADAARVEITAYWKAIGSGETRGGYGVSVLSDGGTGADGVVRFRPDLPEAGRYDVYFYWPALRDTSRQLATNVPVDVRHADGRAAQTVDQRAGAGSWLHLGTFAFTPGADAYVEVRNDAADGVVLADAVRFCRRP